VSERPAVEEVLALDRLLDEAGISGCLIGGVAVNFVLEPRTTEDVDLTIPADAEAISRLRSAFLAAGYVVRTEAAPDAASGPDFLRFVRKDSSPIEFLTAKTPFQENVLSRATALEGTRRLSVATPEDLIVLKLLADRTKDLRDLLGLLELPNLDWSYIEREIRFWDLGGRLDRIRRMRR
jgi:hypothetical protein